MKFLVGPALNSRNYQRRNSVTGQVWWVACQQMVPGGKRGHMQLRMGEWKGRPPKEMIESCLQHSLCSFTNKNHDLTLIKIPVYAH